MSVNLNDIEYNELTTNIVHLYDNLIQNNYTWSNVQTNYYQYISSYITNKIKDLINNDNVNYTIIDNVLSELINENYTFENLFETNNTSPYYTYKQDIINIPLLIYVADQDLNQYYLININYEEIELPSTDTDVEITPESNINLNNISSSVTSSFFNNEILFAKSINAGSNIIEQPHKKNTWSLVTLMDDLDITYSTQEDCNIVIQITASITTISNLLNTYSWGLFNTANESIDKTAIVAVNTNCIQSNSFNSIKSIFFHIGAKANNSYLYKWIHKDENGLNNIKIDSSYPITIIAWKLQNQINDISITYLEHISQKINDLQLAYNNLSKKVDSL